MSWILEDNRAMVNILDNLNADPYKRYLILKKISRYITPGLIVQNLTTGNAARSLAEIQRMVGAGQDGAVH